MERNEASFCRNLNTFEFYATKKPSIFYFIVKPVLNYIIIVEREKK